jgi:hypothetical protein
MIRLPPTTIVLGRSDLKEFESRRLRRMEVEFLNQDFSRFALGGSSGFTLALRKPSTLKNLQLR